MDKKETTTKEKELLDHLELAWGIIANANNGNWEELPKDWVNAAENWRDKYYKDILSDN